MRLHRGHHPIDSKGDFVALQMEAKIKSSCTREEAHDAGQDHRALLRLRRHPTGPFRPSVPASPTQIRPLSACREAPSACVGYCFLAPYQSAPEWSGWGSLTRTDGTGLFGLSGGSQGASGRKAVVNFDSCALPYSTSRTLRGAPPISSPIHLPHEDLVGPSPRPPPQGALEGIGSRTCLV